MTINRVFHKWHHYSQDGERHTVLPDGCRDVLVLSKPNSAAEIFLSDFDFQPRTVTTAPNCAITGFRLRPGILPCRDVLEAIALDPTQAGAILGGAFGHSDELNSVIAALCAPGATPKCVARAAGVSTRTLQRQFQAKGLPGPDFWRLLARARRAVAMLSGPEPLIEIAGSCGFSDQAHMTRELKRWFAISPAPLRKTPVILDILGQPGLGNWTDEQISTQYPLGSLT
ncbi:helix-turn-helix domain-containing protein [Woodsholea maritima]|uniref:helix-turn-helix domain-containing protein n=1 Tax=Woodsholea maritima TaxID=240237 RepID=UPI000A041538